MAPGAVQMTALEENGGTDTRSVIGTEFLDMKNRCGGGGQSCEIHGDTSFFFDFITVPPKCNRERKTGLIQFGSGRCFCNDKLFILIRVRLKAIDVRLDYPIRADI